MRKRTRSLPNGGAALTFALFLAHVTSDAPAVAFIWPALFPGSGGVGGKGPFNRVLGEGRSSRIPAYRTPSVEGNPQQKRINRAREGRGRHFLMFGRDTGGGINSSAAERRRIPTAARTNGADVGEALSLSRSSTKNAEQTFLAIPAFLQNVAPSNEHTQSSIESTSDDDDNLAADSTLKAEGQSEDVSPSTTVEGSPTSSAQEETNEDPSGVFGMGLGAGDVGEDTGYDGIMEDDREEKQERGRRRDMYKIRSLLLQGQIAGLRERLKERELDVRELRVLTGGRGQSKLRELGAMLKKAREECEALRAREKALAQELAASRKEGYVLRGDLLANQKALTDLNVYADSLRSRYTAEMVKLEASLAEMERELTRAEAAHMRERRDLLDREASAVADGERFRNRTILLQGEVLKTRARETKLRHENARLLATSDATASSDMSPATTGEASQKEESALRAENEELRLRLETALSSAAVSAERGTREIPDSSLEIPGAPAEISDSPAEASDASRQVSASVVTAEVTTAAVEIVEQETSESEAHGREAYGAPAFQGWGAASSGASATAAGIARSPSSMAKPIPVEAVLSNPADETDSKPNAIARSAAFADEATAKRAFEEAGVTRVMAGLREENVRLRKRLRATEMAADVAETRANEEAIRADELEAESGRVRVTVKGRVQALKAALEEAEGDAEQALAEKDEHMKQWAEDVDALRAQLVAERRAWNSDRAELEEVVVDLEDELKDLKERYRSQMKSAPKRQKQSSQQKRKSVPDKAKAGKSKSFAPAVSAKDKGPSRSDRDGRVQSAGWSVTPASHDDGCDENDEEYPNEKRASHPGDTKDLSPDQQWDKAMRLMQFLD